jgi:UPF0271 protein
MYHAAMTKPAVAEAIARATRSIDSSLMLVGIAGSNAISQWRAAGFAVVAEAFADRRYEPDGSLTSRTKPGALIENEQDAAAQAVSVATGRGVAASDGRRIAVHAQTICLHSDTPGAPVLAAAVRSAVERAGIVVRAPLR